MNIKEAFKPDLKDREHGYLDITFTKARLIELYLDYVNNFLTVPAFEELTKNQKESGQEIDEYPTAFVMKLEDYVEGHKTIWKG